MNKGQMNYKQKQTLMKKIQKTINNYFSKVFAENYNVIESEHDEYTLIIESKNDLFGGAFIKLVVNNIMNNQDIQHFCIEGNKVYLYLLEGEI